MTLTELTTARDSILSRLAKALTAQSGSNSVTQRSVAELQKALSIIDSEINAATNGSTATIGQLYSREGL